MLDRDAIRDLMDEILERQGPAPDLHDDVVLRDAGFRSLDFSELALRVEEHLGAELNFDAPALRAIVTVGDVLDFFEHARPAAA